MLSHVHFAKWNVQNTFQDIFIWLNANTVFSYAFLVKPLRCLIILLLRLNEMLYALCLSCHSNTEAVCMVSSGWDNG